MLGNSDRVFGPLQAKDGDVRIMRVGRFLRARALDELPQLWNIFKGDMSFVEPRALLPEEIELNGNWKLVPLEKIRGYEERHRVRPGLTGLAQVYAVRDVPRKHRFRCDILFTRRQSYLLDLKLIALSIWISLKGRWESGGKKY